MNILTLLATFLFTFTSTQAAAETIGKVLAFTGAVQLDGKTPIENDPVSDGAKLITPAGAHLSVALSSGYTVSIQPDTEVKLGTLCELTRGTVRWSNSTKTSGSPTKKSKLRIQTQSATMGVRGTDFLTIANALLGETEILVFDGLVDFGSKADSKNLFTIKKGQWGGIGGRFGGSIRTPLDLPPNVITEFDRLH